MDSDYEPVFLANDSITSKKHKVGEILKFRILEVMDDGVKAVCDHGKSKPPENHAAMMRENSEARYREAMGGDY